MKKAEIHKVKDRCNKTRKRELKSSPSLETQHIEEPELQASQKLSCTLSRSDHALPGH